jgi:hypothetical protein
MKKVIILLTTMTALIATLVSCPTGPVVPTNSPPYEPFEIEQGLALRDDHVCLMALSIVPRHTLGLIGGISDKVPGGTTESGNIMTLILGDVAAAELPSHGWSIPDALPMKLIGGYAGIQVWGYTIDRSLFTTNDLTDDSLYYTWKYVYGDDYNYTINGSQPFINQSDFNNACGRLNKIPTPTGSLSVFTGDNPSYTQQDYIDCNSFEGLGSY